MRKRAMKMGSVLMTALLVSFAVVAEDDAPGKENTGKDLSFNNKKGNCLACHAMPTVEDAEQPGNSGPPLIAMSARFPNKSDLRAKIWDATATNPSTMMPAFGKHKALTEKEIDMILDFIYGL